MMGQFIAMQSCQLLCGPEATFAVGWHRSSALTQGPCYLEWLGKRLQSLTDVFPHQVCLTHLKPHLSHFCSFYISVSLFSSTAFSLRQLPFYFPSQFQSPIFPFLYQPLTWKHWSLVSAFLVTVPLRSPSLALHLLNAADYLQSFAHVLSSKPYPHFHIQLLSSHI